MSRQMALRAHAEAMSPQDMERLDAEVALAKQMAEILQKLFPGHQWATFADSRQGIVWLAIPELMGPSTRYVLHISQIADYDDMCKQLREAGGQVLERFRMRRGKFELHEFADALKHRVTDHKTPMPE